MKEIYDIWFNNFLNLDNNIKQALMSEYNSTYKIYYNDFSNLEEKYSKEVIEKIKSSKTLFKRFEVTEIIKENDKIYPKSLRNIYYPPKRIYVLGKDSKLDSLNRKKVAIVGSRNATSYGLDIAYNIAYELAKSGITVISGMARGIDSFAHYGALKAKGKTIAVLGSGLDIVYPKENLRLMNEIIESGAVVTEYDFNVPPLSKNFPRRNRIISGMSDLVLVIEAEEKSGSLITARLALDEGRDVAAIPGNINSKFSKGTNLLIKEGAYVVTCANDVLELLKNYN